jgi:hypothetical protein
MFQESRNRFLGSLKSLQIACLVHSGPLTLFHTVWAGSQLYTDILQYSTIFGMKKYSLHPFKIFVLNPNLSGTRKVFIFTSTSGCKKVRFSKSEFKLMENLPIADCNIR